MRSIRYTALLALAICFAGIDLMGKRYFEQDIDNPSRKVDSENIIFFDGFESGGFHFLIGKYNGPKKGPQWFQAQFQGDYSVKFVDSPVRSGKKAVRFEWQRKNVSPTSNTSRKAMIHYAKNPQIEGGERWFGFSMLIPEGEGVPDPTSYKSLIFQLHATPDKDLKERYRIPMYSLHIHDGEIICKFSYDLEKLSPHNDNIKKNMTIAKLAKTNKFYNQWIDFVVHSKLSLKKKGLLQVWLNGKMVLNLKDINLGYNDKVGGYPSWGLYSGKVKNKSPKMVLFFDEIYIGNENANYYNVAPGKFDNTQKKME